jgi:hypothetical protein
LRRGPAVDHHHALARAPQRERGLEPGRPASGNQYVDNVEQSVGHARNVAQGGAKLLSCDKTGMKRIMLCVSAVALASILGTPWSSSRALAAESAPAPKATNASCALVTKAEAEAILGEPLDDLTSPSSTPATTATSRTDRIS